MTITNNRQEILQRLADYPIEPKDDGDQALVYAGTLADYLIELVEYINHCVIRPKVLPDRRSDVLNDQLSSIDQVLRALQKQNEERKAEINVLRQMMTTRFGQLEDRMDSNDRVIEVLEERLDAIEKDVADKNHLTGAVTAKDIVAIIEAAKG